MRIFALAVFITLCVSTGGAQTVKDPALLLQHGVLVGAAKTITASRVPVFLSSGEIVYKNILIQFDVDADGTLRIASDFPLISDAPKLDVVTFRVGSYIGPGSVLGGKTPAFVDGPGATVGGATTWSFTSAAEADVCTYPSSATWYVGPIENTPVASRLKKAGITSTAWSYGVANGPKIYDRCGTGNSFQVAKWQPGTLVGVSQTGNSITISSFTEYNTDYSTPVDQVTYRLTQ